MLLGFHTLRITNNISFARALRDCIQELYMGVSVNRGH